MANTVDKVIAIANAEVGYLEKKSNSQLENKTANAGSNNYTKYWKDMAPGMNGQSWCNAFVNWCFVKAYGEKEAKKLLCTNGAWSYYTPTSAGYFKSNKQWYASKPQVGDIIYFKNSQRIHHVGIVYKVDSSNVYTIEGNTSGGSAVISNGGGTVKKKYQLNNSAIAGYGRPKYDIEQKPATTTPATTPKPTTTQPATQKKEEEKYTKEQFIKDLKVCCKLSDSTTTEQLVKKLPTISRLINKKHGVVKYIQKYLNALGYDCGTPDCDFGKNSEEGTKAFQKANKLTVDGTIGSKTWKKMLGV